MSEIVNPRQPCLRDYMDRYPVKNGPAARRVSLSDIICEMADAIEEADKVSPNPITADYTKYAEILDREFLFGAWGMAWPHMDEKVALQLLENMRGMILHVYRTGKQRGRQSVIARV